MRGLVGSVPHERGDMWLALDWIDGRRLYSIDDAYRYFAGRNATHIPSLFLWNYVMPLALSFDAALAFLTDGNLLGMRLAHACAGVMTLAIIVRASIKAGCGYGLALGSALIVGLMPVFLIVSSSFYGEGLFALLLAGAILFHVERRRVATAVTLGLLPLVRPEGAVYVVAFLFFYLAQRDLKSAAITLVPGLAYLGTTFLFSDTWLASMTWRLELREILAPFNSGNNSSVSLGRLPNPAWLACAFLAPLIPAYRRFWPLIAGALFLILVQILTLSRGVQDYELRYLYSLLPVVGVVWAFPPRALLDRIGQQRRIRTLLGAGLSLLVGGVIVGHSLQSDWIRNFATGFPDRPLSTAGPTGRAPTSINRLLAFDPGPLQGFTQRVNAYLQGRPSIHTVFVAVPAPLYFLEPQRASSPVNVVLVPHNAGIARYSDGYYFGFDLQKLDYEYFRFAATEGGSALFLVDDTGIDPFAHESPDPSADVAATVGNRRRVATPILQSGSIKAFVVNFESTRSVEWQFPDVVTNQ